MYYSDSKIVQHFTERAENYNEGEHWVNNSSVLNTINSFLPQKKSRIVDLGAGTCIVSDYILKNQVDDYSIYAVDINEDMLNKCQNNDIVRIVSDIEKMPFNNSFFDVAVSRQCLHYISDIDKALKEIKRVIKSKGIFIFAQIIPFDVETHNYWSSIVNIRQPLRKQYFNEQMWISKIIENGFKLTDKNQVITRSSLHDWIYKYNICDQSKIQQMVNLFNNASLDYKKKYRITYSDNDIIYNSNWMIAKFVSI